MKQTTTGKTMPYNKYLYIIFLLGAIIFTGLKDYGTAMIFGGIGLVFDPFNQQVPFTQRPVWQKVWLVVHLVFVFIILWLTLKNH